MGDFVTNSSVVETGVWCHVTFTYNKHTSSLIVMVNNKEVLNKTVDIAIDNDMSALLIGSDLSANRFLGNMDNIVLYERALERVEMETLLAQFDSDPELWLTDHLQGYWTFDESLENRASFPDRSANNRPAANDGELSYGDDVFKGNASVRITDGASLSAANDGFDSERMSIGAWLKPSVEDATADVVNKPDAFRFGLDNGVPCTTVSGNEDAAERLVRPLMNFVSQEANAGALHFNGTYNWSADAPLSDSEVLLRGALTASFWWRATDATERTLLSRGGFGRMTVGGGALRLYDGADKLLSTVNRIEVGAWYHTAVSRDALYVDGISYEYLSPPLWSRDDSLRFGNNLNGNNGFNGYLDEIALFDTTLDAIAVRRLRARLDARDLPVTTGSLLQYHTFEVSAVENSAEPGTNDLVVAGAVRATGTVPHDIVIRHTKVRGAQGVQLAHYDLSDASAGTESSGAYPATVEGGTSVEGFNQLAYTATAFDGTSGGARTPASLSAEFDVTKMTASAWLRVDTMETGRRYPIMSQDGRFMWWVEKDAEGVVRTKLYLIRDRLTYKGVVVSADTAQIAADLDTDGVPHTVDALITTVPYDWATDKDTIVPLMTRVFDTADSQVLGSTTSYPPSYTSADWAPVEMSMDNKTYTDFYRKTVDGVTYSVWSDSYRANEEAHRAFGRYYDSSGDRGTLYEQGNNHGWHGSVENWTEITWVMHTDVPLNVARYWLRKRESNWESAPNIQSPNKYDVYVSSDGVTWIKVDSRTSTAGLASDSAHAFDIPAYEGVYSWIKFHVVNQDNRWFSQTDWRFEAARLEDAPASSVAGVFPPRYVSAGWSTVSMDADGGAKSFFQTEYDGITYSVWSDSFRTNEEPYRVFCSNMDTSRAADYEAGGTHGWHSASESWSSIYWIMHTSAPLNITRYWFRARSYSSPSLQRPNNYDMYVSNDGATWTLIDSRTNVASTIPHNSTKSFDAPPYEGTYNWVKFHFKDNGNGWFSQTDWRFEGTSGEGATKKVDFALNTVVDAAGAPHAMSSVNNAYLFIKATGGELGESLLVQDKSSLIPRIVLETQSDENPNNNTNASASTTLAAGDEWYNLLAVFMDTTDQTQRHRHVLQNQDVVYGQIHGTSRSINKLFRDFEENEQSDTHWIGRYVKDATYGGVTTNEPAGNRHGQTMIYEFASPSRETNMLNTTGFEYKNGAHHSGYGFYGTVYVFYRVGETGTDFRFHEKFDQPNSSVSWYTVKQITFTNPTPPSNALMFVFKGATNSWHNIMRMRIFAGADMLVKRTLLNVPHLVYFDGMSPLIASVDAADAKVVVEDVPNGVYLSKTDTVNEWCNSRLLQPIKMEVGNTYDFDFGRVDATVSVYGGLVFGYDYALSNNRDGWGPAVINLKMDPSSWYSWHTPEAEAVWFDAAGYSLIDYDALSTKTETGSVASALPIHWRLTVVDAGGFKDILVQVFSDPGRKTLYMQGHLSRVARNVAGDGTANEAGLRNLATLQHAEIGFGVVVQSPAQLQLTNLVETIPSTPALQGRGSLFDGDDDTRLAIGAFHSEFGASGMDHLVLMNFMRNAAAADPSLPVRYYENVPRRQVQSFDLSFQTAFTNLRNLNTVDTLDTEQAYQMVVLADNARGERFKKVSAGKRFDLFDDADAYSFTNVTHANDRYTRYRAMGPSWMSITTSGNYAVVWSAVANGNSKLGVYLQITSAGGAKSPVVTLAEDATYDYQLPAVAGIGDDKVAVVYLQRNGANYERRLFYHVLETGGGAAVTSQQDFQIDLAAKNFQLDTNCIPDIVYLNNDQKEFVITWDDYYQHQHRYSCNCGRHGCGTCTQWQYHYNIFCQVCSADGSLSTGITVHENNDTNAHYHKMCYPRVSVTNDAFVVIWQYYNEIYLESYDKNTHARRRDQIDINPTALGDWSNDNCYPTTIPSIDGAAVVCVWMRNPYYNASYTNTLYVASYNVTSTDLVAVKTETKFNNSDTSNDWFVLGAPKIVINEAGDGYDVIVMRMRNPSTSADRRVYKYVYHFDASLAEVGTPTILSYFDMEEPVDIFESIGNPAMFLRNSEGKRVEAIVTTTAEDVNMAVNVAQPVQISIGLDIVEE